MSMFLPEGFGQTQPQDGVASITPSSPETTSEDIALMQRVLSAAMRNPNLIPADFMSYIVDYIQTSRLIVPIGQVFGYSQQKAKTASVPAQESTASGSYGDLTTPGPTLTGLPKGQYLVLFGATITTDITTGFGVMTIELNADPASDTNSINAVGGGTVRAANAYGFTTAFAADSNSLTAKYKTTGGATSFFANRWLVALKFAN